MLPSSSHPSSYPSSHVQRTHHSPQPLPTQTDLFRLPSSWLRTTMSAYYTTYPLLLLRVFTLLNVFLALTPLFRPKDACEDIPLTPAQRHHLGLPPMTRPATPQEESGWVTPPRYSRSGTPASSSTSSVRGVSDSSPLGGRGNNTPLESSVRRSVSGSPYGGALQQRASPLPSSFRNNNNSGGDGSRRLSFQSSFVTGPSELEQAGSSYGIGTPTRTGKQASVGLNSKWLYERGRGSPRGSPRGSGVGFGGGSGFGTGFGGSGSVFS